MEALILALGSSEISRIVNVGTLRYFIEFTFRDMFTGSSFDLGPLWNTLAVEPGVTPEMIYPPLLRFRDWQERLEITVTLPKPMQELPAEELEGHLARVQVSAAELDRIFDDGAAARPAKTPSGKVVPAAAAPRSAVPPRTTPRLSEKYLRPGTSAARDDDDEPPARYTTANKVQGPGGVARKRGTVLVVCAVVAVAAFGFVGRRLFGHHGSSTSMAQVESLLKLDSARRVDYAVTAVLVDPRWESMSRDERRKVLDEVFRTLEADGVKSLVLRGPGGESRAMATSVGGQRTLKVE
jgi:hypothetical protein